MSIYRFLDEQIQGAAKETVYLLTDAKQVKQIQRVLRLEKQDVLEIIDGQGKLYRCKIEEIDRDSIKLKVLDTVQESQDSVKIKLEVALPLLKSDRFEFAIQKLTELGVSTISPIITSRSVVKQSEKHGNDFTSAPKYKRWMSISKEATEQSERMAPPLIKAPSEFEEYLISLSQNGPDHALSFICLAREEAPPLVDYFLKKNSIASPVTPRRNLRIIIGPEGGFTEIEIQKAKIAGCLPSNLGKTILRSETAAIAACTLAMNLGDFL